MKKIEKQTIANYLHNLRVAYSGGKTLREFCKEHNFDASLWSMLENGLWHEFTTEEIIEKYPPLFPNQEVSQPEEKKDDNNWYCECGEPANNGEHICKKKEVENNTEEWVEKFDDLLLRYIDKECEEKDLIEFIEKLLSERSFSKEELESIRRTMPNAGNSEESLLMYHNLREKVDRLLGLER